MTKVPHHGSCHCDAVEFEAVLCAELTSDRAVIASIVRTVTPSLSPPEWVI